MSGTTCKKNETTPLWAWTQAACLAFAFATAYAIAVVFLRLPLAGLEHRDLFRVALALHVELAVFVWLSLTMAGQWASSIGTIAWRWPVVLSVAGTAMLALSPLAGGNAVMADYFPWLANNRAFSVAFGLVSLGVLSVAVQRLWLRASLEDSALRLVAWIFLCALGAALTTAVSDHASGLDIAWAAGHTLLFAHVAMLSHEWTVHGQGDPRRALMAVRALLVVSVCMVLLPFVFTPGSPAFHGAYTLTMSGFLWLPPLWVALGLRGRQADAGAPASRLALNLSITFFLLGILLGALISATSVATTLVTAHYHAAVGAVALSRMGMAYRGMRLMTQMPGVQPVPLRWPAVRGQLLTYAAALLFLIGGLSLASVEGAPRKTSAGELSVKGPWYRAGMMVSGVGGTLAMVGTVWLLFNLLAAGKGRAGVPSCASFRIKELPRES